MAKEHPFDDLSKHELYKPKDPNFRGGFKASIIKAVKKDDLIYYWCGGQKFVEDWKVFKKQYKINVETQSKMKKVK